VAQLTTAEAEVELLPQALPNLFEPGSRVGAVDDVPQKSQAFADVVTIAPDIFLSALLGYPER
jgi:hypothetical protein